MNGSLERTAVILWTKYLRSVGLREIESAALCRKHANSDRKVKQLNVDCIFYGKELCIQLYSPFGRIKIKYKNSQTRTHNKKTHRT